MAKRTNDSSGASVFPVSLCEKMRIREVLGKKGPFHRAVNESVNDSDAATRLLPPSSGTLPHACIGQEVNTELELGHGCRVHG